VHGKERAKLTLSYYKYQTSPEWILTDDIALENLSVHYPHEYLIYAVCYLIPEILDPEHMPDCNKQIEMKIKAWARLQLYDKDLIANISELARQILGANRPAAVSDMLAKFTLDAITKNAVSMGEFQMTLQACLQKVRERYYDPERIAARNRQMQRFNMQAKIKHLENWELSIFMDDELNNLEIITGIKNPAVVEIKTTSKKIKTLLKSKTKGIAPITGVKFTGLNLGSKSE